MQTGSMKLRQQSALKAVARDTTLTERVQQQIEDLILDQALLPGERLPSENEMARTLTVSRSVVREAIRLLTAKGLVAARNGSGIYVRALGAELVSQPIQLLCRARGLTTEQLIEIRAALETATARLAAERATAQDIAALEAAVKRLEDPALGFEEHVQADLAFHRCLAVATHNPLFEVFTEALTLVLAEFLSTAFAHDHRRSAESAAIDHGRILARVKAGDSEGAAREMSAELAKASKSLSVHRRRR